MHFQVLSIWDGRSDGGGMRALAFTMSMWAGVDRVWCEAYLSIEEGTRTASWQNAMLLGRGRRV